jgi:hypothetical protein
MFQPARGAKVRDSVQVAGARPRGPNACSGDASSLCARLLYEGFTWGLGGRPNTVRWFGRFRGTSVNCPRRGLSTGVAAERPHRALKVSVCEKILQYRNPPRSEVEETGSTRGLEPVSSPAIATPTLARPRSVPEHQPTPRNSLALPARLRWSKNLRKSKRWRNSCRVKQLDLCNTRHLGHLRSAPA